MVTPKSVIESMTLEELRPSPPEITTSTPQEVDLAAEKIRGVVERLSKPWVHGAHLQRFARQCGLTLEEVKVIKAEYEDYLKNNPIEVLTVGEEISIPKVPK